MERKTPNEQYGQDDGTVGCATPDYKWVRELTEVERPRILDLLLLVCSNASTRTVSALSIVMLGLMGSRVAVADPFTSLHLVASIVIGFLIVVVALVALVCGHFQDGKTKQTERIKTTPESSNDPGSKGTS